ncbi:MAG: DoxX family protein [Flavisolibacter sp.]|jgi:putative oxidoreductase
MRRLLATDSKSTAALIARLFLAAVVFPHGAQKLLGWFGGNGFSATLKGLTQDEGLSGVIAFLVIIIEFFAPLLLLFGFLTRLAAFVIGVEFVGIVLKAHIHNGFFMNWYQQPGKGEGLEYFILLFGLVITAFILGGGRMSMDATLSNRPMD